MFFFKLGILPDSIASISREIEVLFMSGEMKNWANLSSAVKRSFSKHSK
jgi:hypothetical protein